jgi:phage major head subunit gpT-like protein
MLINKETLTAVFLNLKTTFNKAFDAAPSQWQQTAMLVPSGSSQNNYDWLDRFPKMRKWIGDKIIRAMKANTYTVVNDDFEATVGVRRNDIEDDNLGIYAPMAQDAGYSAKTLPDEIVSDLKNNAFVNTCYDGQYFYDTDHPVEDGNGNTGSVSNKGTAVLDYSTLAAIQGSYGAARTAVQTMKDNEGRPLGLVPDILEVPPALEATANVICNNEFLGDKTPNPYKGTAKVIVNPRLTSSTAWFLHCTSRPVKPFVYQQRKAPVFVQQINPDADDVFMRGEYKYGTEARCAGGYAFWQMSYGSTGAG